MAAPVCPVCDSERSEPFAVHDGISLFACGACGTVYMFPLPDPAAARALSTGAFTDYFRKADKKMRRARGRMRGLARCVSEGRFLDVGCSGGFMVEAARARGFDAWGLDVDPVAIDYARSHYPENTYVLGPVEGLEAPAGGFDLIYSSEVIEHVPDVNGFVAALARLLRPGGILFVTTPDISHWRRPRKLEAWDGFRPPGHCIYFRPSSLRYLLERHGLEVLRKRAAWKPGIKMIARRRDRAPAGLRPAGGPRPGARWSATRPG